MQSNGWKARYPDGSLVPLESAPRRWGFEIVGPHGEDGGEVRVCEQARAEALYRECRAGAGREKYDFGGLRRWARVHFEPFGADMWAPEFWVYDADANDGAPGRMTYRLVSSDCGCVVQGAGVTRDRLILVSP